MIKISLEPEYVMKIGNFSISNTLICSWITILILVFLTFLVRKSFKKVPKAKSLQNLFEALIEKILNYIETVAGSRSLAQEVFPLIATFFIYIVSENLLALLPGFLGALKIETPEGTFPLLKSPNADLNSTLALALISVFSIQYFGIKTLGFKRYLKRFFNFASPLKWIIGIFELLSDLTKILSLSLRLFGNVLAGEVLLLTVAFFLPYFLPLPFMILEIFVGIIQAFIFATLSLVFIKSAQMEF